MTLSGFDGLAAHFERVLAGISTATQQALEASGALVETAAKGKLGHYQSSAGPFAAWAQLAEFTQADRVSKGFSANDPLLRTGRLQAAITHYVVRRETHIGVANASVGAGTTADPVRNIGDVAEAMELGTAKIPPRSFLGSSLFEQGAACQHIVNVRFARLLATGA